MNIPQLNYNLESARGVEIPLDYLIQSHVLLNKSYEKMKELLGESVAMMFFTLASEYGPTETIAGGLEELEATMSRFGYSIKEHRRGDEIEYRLYCPHAAKVHPHLGDSASFCPMSQMVLGALRREHKKSVITSSRLFDDGSLFVARLQDEGVEDSKDTASNAP